MRKNTLWQRIKIACNFVIYGKGLVRIMTCGKCGKQTIVSITQKSFESTYIKGDKHIDLYWSDFNQCLKCGAVCKEVQMWNFEGKAEKIDNNITVED